MKTMLYDAHSAYDNFIEEERKLITERLKQLDNRIEFILLELETKLQEVFNQRRDIINLTPIMKPVCREYTDGFKNIEEVVRKTVTIPEIKFCFQVDTKKNDRGD
jgi:phosphate uptake regulator